MVPWAHSRSTHQSTSRLIEPFSLDSQTWPTDRHTGRPRYSVCSNRPRLAIVVMRSNNNLTVCVQYSITISKTHCVNERLKLTKEVSFKPTFKGIKYCSTSFDNGRDFISYLEWTVSAVTLTKNTVLSSYRKKTSSRKLQKSHHFWARILVAADLAPWPRDPVCILAAVIGIR